MTLSGLKSQMLYNDFYRKYYQSVVITLLACVFVTLCVVIFVLYQILNRPLPPIYAHAAGDGTMTLVPYDEPNLLSTTIVRWARKAVVTAYTYDFVNYQQQLAAARPYFTPAGWANFQRSIAPLLQTVRQNQLFVNGVVTAPPVFSNQGQLPGKGYVWRIQIPFLVTYQTAETTSKQNFTVVMSIVKIPTRINPTGIGIDQFVMY